MNIPDISDIPGWIVSHLFWEFLKQKAEKTVAYFSPVTVVPNWIARINTDFQDQVEIIGQYKIEPSIKIDGNFTLSGDLERLAKEERLRLEQEGKPNDPHAVLVSEPQWKADPIQFSAKKIDFAGVCALRQQGEKPQILSSSALVVCRESRQILLHERSPDVHTYPRRIHTIGGAYIPPSPRTVNPDRRGLRSTLQREAHEETQLALSGSEFPPMIAAKELSTGFVQLVFLGFAAKASALKQLDGNWEGNPLLFPFDSVPGLLLKSEDWVPSGKAHLLAWLALGAPNAGPSPKFGKLTPGELFETAIGG